MTRYTQRKNSERRFKLYGVIAISVSLIFVLILMFNIFKAGLGGFYKTVFTIPFHFDQQLLKLEDHPSSEQIQKASFRKLIANNFEIIFDGYSKDEIKDINKIFYRKIDQELQQYLINNPDSLNKTINVSLTASTDIDQIHKGNFDRSIPEKFRKVNDFQLKIYDELLQKNQVEIKYW